MAERIISDGRQTLTPAEAKRREGIGGPLSKLFGNEELPIEEAGTIESTLGIPLLPAIGTALGTAAVIKGGADLWSGNNDKSPAGQASRVQTGITTGGLSELGRLFGMGSSPGTKLEEERRAKLREKGIDLGPDKNWELNDKFKTSRNEADLTGKDITKAANLYDVFGDSYGNASEGNQIKAADELVKLAAIREHHGTIDVLGDKLTADNRKRIDDILNTPAPETPNNSGEQRQSSRQAKGNKKKARQQAIAEAFLPKPTMPQAPTQYTQPTNSYDYQSLVNKAMGR